MREAGGMNVRVRGEVEARGRTCRTDTSKAQKENRQL